MSSSFHYQGLLPSVLAVASLASNAIMDVYKRSTYHIESKADRSPVTEADLQAHTLIEAGLSKIEPGFPILSEEGYPVPYEVRSQWERFWLVDPLDGTREFIQGTGEFTVNIALIENHSPVLGVVMVPAFNQCYWAIRGQQAYFRDSNQQLNVIRVNPRPQYPIKIAASRCPLHPHSEWEQLLRELEPIEVIHCGSALKMCLVARGIVDLYPRFGPTHEWDTGAGHCILEAAGGRLVDMKGKTLQYNFHRTLINPGFFAVNCADLLTRIVDNFS